MSRNTDALITKDELGRKYIDEHLSTRKIAEQIGCSPNKVKSLLQQYGIPIRSNRLPDIDQKQLREMYIDQGKTSKEIAEELQCSAGFVINQLHKHGIPTRAETQQQHIGELTKDTLYQLYAVEQKTSSEIASEYNVSKRTVLLLLDKFGIEKRHHKEYVRIETMSLSDKKKMKESFIQDRITLKDLAKEYDIFLNALLRFAEDDAWYEARHAHELEQITELIALDPNISYSKIQKATSLPRGVVKKCCEELGHIRKIKRMSDLDQKAIIRTYCEEGKSIKSIADDNGVSFSTIYKLLKKEGCVRHREDIKISIDTELLYKRYVIDHATYADLCNEFDISPISLNRILKRNGIDLNRTVQHKDEWDDFSSFVRHKFEEHQDKIDVLELAHYFDVSPAAVRSKIRKSGLQDYVSLYRLYAEQQWEEWLKEQDITYKSNVRDIIAPQEIDLFLPQYNVGLEINPTITHNSDIDVFGHSPKKTTYHQKKARAAEQMGMNLINIFDWYDENKIKSIILGLCHRNERIFARNTSARVVDRKSEQQFLEDHHLQGYVASEHAYGLYDDRNDKLLAVMTFREPRYNNKEQCQWELLRFCTKSGVSIVGGASKLFRTFIRERRPASVMSFANMDISNGNMYEKLGFSFVRYTPPSFHWVKLNDPSEHYSWNLVNQIGFDKIFGTNYGKGTSNAALMLEHGFVRVFNSGNKVYTWHADAK